MISSAPPPRAPRRIGLIVEGAPPFGSGGASTWARQMIEAMPDLEFSIHCVGDRDAGAVESGGELPANVRSVTTSRTCDVHARVQARPGHGSHRRHKEVLGLVRAFLRTTDSSKRFELLCQAAAVLRDAPGMCTLADLLDDEGARRLLTEFHQANAANAPFQRYCATVRDLATALWTLLHAAATLPTADVYHSVCTGYAGLVGALASHLNNVPLLLSQHGVSLEERIETIRKSDHLAVPPDLTAPFEGDLGIFRNLWISFFELLGRMACDQAAGITALSPETARLQVESGASPERVTIIPNGIDTMRFSDIAREKLQPNPDPDHRLTVGFRGRLVPIKDIKTLLRAARLVLRTHPETRFLLAGSTDDAPDYFDECLALTHRLGIAQSVEFPGPMPPDDFLRQSDIVIRTSICDGLPFGLLEASAAGLPVVATDVGACRELIAEQIPSHPTLGPAGLITMAAHPADPAAALRQLLDSAELRFEHGMNGLRRVQSAYRLEDVVDRYHKFYHALADHATRPVAVAP